MRVGLGGIRTHAQKVTSSTCTMHLVVQLLGSPNESHQRITPLFMLFDFLNRLEDRTILKDLTILKNKNQKYRGYFGGL